MTDTKTSPPSSIIALADGSPPAQRALDLAVTMSRALSVPLQIVTVHEPEAFNTDVSVFEAALPKGAAPATESARRRVLDEAHARVGADAQATTVLLEGRPIEALLRYLDNQEGCLIVLGRTGKTALTRVIKGSVATAMTMYSHHPVIIVP